MKLVDNLVHGQIWKPMFQACLSQQMRHTVTQKAHMAHIYIYISMCIYKYIDILLDRKENEKYRTIVLY